MSTDRKPIDMHTQIRKTEMRRAAQMERVSGRRRPSRCPLGPSAMRRFVWIRIIRGVGSLLRPALCHDAPEVNHHPLRITHA
mgnify:CR=1 FL=1